MEKLPKAVINSTVNYYHSFVTYKYLKTMKNINIFIVLLVMLAVSMAQNDIQVNLNEAKSNANKKVGAPEEVDINNIEDSQQ